MGASGTGPFENDGALDLCGDLEDLTPAGVHARLRQALTVVAEADEEEYVDVDLGQEAVAAAAIVAARRSGDTATLEAEDLDGLIPADLDGLTALAAAALTRVLAENSELSALWSESSLLDDQWRASIQALLTTLR